MNALPFPLPSMQPGHVWLLGAGPGDPGLLSLLAGQALREADIVVYDALVNPVLLDLAKPEAIREFAGKRGGKPSARQPDISQRLVDLARAGHRVARLKGGDPFVFGRGAEEALALAAAQIPFRVVPGITAAVGALAYAGIPATSRDTNSAIAFITGHDSAGNVPDTVDWRGLVQAVPVLVFYMAINHLERLVARLIEAGRSTEEAAAVIAGGTLPRQHVIVAPLGEIAAATRKAAPEPPALLVVGPTVALRDHLAWLPYT
jgi:uroporphyrin-III C-methyltransferase